MATLIPLASRMPANAAGPRLASCTSGYGEVDAVLRNPRHFCADGPLARAGRVELARNDPRLVAREEAPLLRRLGTRFYLSSGPGHGKVQPPDTVRFARELEHLGISRRLRLLRDGRHQWERQLAAGLRWAVGPND